MPPLGPPVDRGSRRPARARGRRRHRPELSERLGQEPFELTADSLHYDIERELYIGRGNVVISQSGRTLKADWVAFNRKTGAGLASGSVQLEDGGDVVTADFVEFEIETIQGTLHGARLEAADVGRFRASAAEIAEDWRRGPARSRRGAASPTSPLSRTDTTSTDPGCWLGGGGDRGRGLCGRAQHHVRRVRRAAGADLRGWSFPSRPSGRRASCSPSSRSAASTASSSVCRSSGRSDPRPASC